MTNRQQVIVINKGKIWQELDRLRDLESHHRRIYGILKTNNLYGETPGEKILLNPKFKQAKQDSNLNNSSNMFYRAAQAD